MGARLLRKCRKIGEGTLGVLVYAAAIPILCSLQVFWLGIQKV